MCPGVCQSWVMITCRKPAAILFTSGTIWSPSLTGRAPPGMKSFWTSTITSRARSSGLTLPAMPWAPASPARPMSPAAAAPAITPERNSRRFDLAMGHLLIGGKYSRNPRGRAPPAWLLLLCDNPPTQTPAGSRAEPEGLDAEAEEAARNDVAACPFAAGLDHRGAGSRRTRRRRLPDRAQARRQPGLPLPRRQRLRHRPGQPVLAPGRRGHRSLGRGGLRRHPRPERDTADRAALADGLHAHRRRRCLLDLPHVPVDLRDRCHLPVLPRLGRRLPPASRHDACETARGPRAGRPGRYPQADGPTQGQ